MIGAALKEEKSSRQKFVSGETTVGKSSMALVGLLGRVGGPFKPPERDDGCDLATVAPLLLATGADMVGFKTPHRCPQLAVENPFSPLRLLSPLPGSSEPSETTEWWDVFDMSLNIY